VIKAALNGRRTRAEHSAIPITPQELAASAKESFSAGAECIHYHVRGADGLESLDPKDLASSLNAMRTAIPSTPIGVSTGAWILRDQKRRYELVSQWQTLPDFASVNFNEDGAVELAELILEKKIQIEAGLSDLAGTEIFVKSGLANQCLRLLVEPMDLRIEDVLKTLAGILALLKKASVRLPIVLHGLNEQAWRMIDEAAARGFDTRVGLEDILTMPDGSVAAGNGALVAEAARRMAKAGSHR
jgi:uncharacterized protein (DUF849 family)